MGGLRAVAVVQNHNSDDEEALLIEQHAGLVKRIAHHMIVRLPSSIQIDDLLQAGMIGLLEAARHFDPSKGASFETYAGIRIRGGMLDEIRRNDWVPRSVHRNTRMIMQAIHEVENRKGSDARDHEVAEHLGIPLNTYHHMLSDTNNSKLYAIEELAPEGGMEISTETIPGPLERLQRENFQEKLAEGIAGLPERERLVLALYYDEDLNLKEVGRVLGVSESRISQIHSQAMLRLQGRLQEWRGGVA